MYGDEMAGGPMTIDPRGKSDFDAGLLFFATVAQLYPGVTWADLQNPQFLSGWWTNLKKAAGDVKDGIGDIISDTVGLVSRKGGETVRLASDPKVADTVSRAGAAYATGGGSEGARSFLGSLSSIFTPSGTAAVNEAGAAYKAGFGINLKSPWVVGGAIGLAALLAFSLTRPRAAA